MSLLPVFLILIPVLPLIYLSYRDFKHKQVPLWCLLVLFISCLPALFLINDPISILKFYPAIAACLFCALLSKPADAVGVLFCSLSLSFIHLLFVPAALALGICMASVFHILNKKISVAAFPFLTFSYVSIVFFYSLTQFF